MLKLDDLRGAINLYRGAVQFALPLASLPGISDEGYALTLTYDSGSVDETVINWNLSHPTGLAGLGWDVETNRIAIDYGDALGSDQAVSNPIITLRLGGADYQLVQTGSSAAGLTYVTEPYQFWSISYTPTTEIWTVVLENGTRLIFGDLSSGRNTVDWGYAWGNWIGASGNATNRARVSVGWSMSQMTNVWGSSYVFTYDQTTANLGSNPAVSYTQASYLVRVDGPSGGSVVLTYADKLPAEYQSPHSGADASAWQSRFATKALSSVSEVAAGGATLAVTTLNYLGAGNTVATIGTGNRTKRLLMGLSRNAPGGYKLPNISFTYDENPTSLSYGALLSVTTPAGGTAVLTYARPALTLPKRDQALTPPVKTGVTYDSPRVFFGRESVIVLWHGSDNSVAANAYLWEGRWLAASVVAPSASDVAAYNQLRVVVSEECFAIVGATTYTLFHADPNMPGAWIGSTAPEPLGLPNGEAVALAAGSTYIALLATSSGTLIMRWFDGAAWQTMNVPANSGTQVAALDGTSDGLLRLSSTATGPTHDLALLLPDLVQGWITRSLRLSSWVSGLDSATVAMGETYAVVTLMGWSGANRSIAYNVVWWNASGQSVQSMLLKTVNVAPSALPAPASVRGSTVLLGQDVYRFDGVSWKHQDLSLLTHPNQQSVPQIALGADVVTRAVLLTTNALVYDTLTYNAASTSATPWSYAPGMNAVPAKAGTVTKAMTALFNPGEPGEASRFLLFNNQLFLLSGDGTWTSLLDISATFTADTISSLQLFGETYLIYQTASAVEAYPLRGGGLAVDSGIALANAKLLTGTSQSLVGENAFVAYTGTWGQAGVALTLYRPVAEDVRNALTPLTATSITLYGSGVPTQPGPLPYNAVPYVYGSDLATATVSRDGRRMAANKAVLAAGATSLTQPPNGSVATYFFNGLSAAESPAWPYPTDATMTNAASNVAHLDGVPYSEFAFAQGQSTSTSTEAAWWWVTTTRVNARTMTSYWRCRKIAESLDAVPSARTMTYSTDTGLVTQVAATTAGGQAILTSYTYWWEKYDATRSLNLLTPVVQCMEYADTALVRGSVTTWNDNWGAGSGQWAAHASYIATSATPAPFTAWTGTPNPVPSGWVIAEEIDARSTASMVQATVDALGQKASSLTSVDGTMQIASLANADVLGQEAYYYGFESYEDPGPWSYQGGAISDHLVVGEANLGTRSLEIVPNTASQTGPTASWVPTGQDRSYQFSCWVQTSANFGSVTGAAQFTIMIYTLANPPQPVGSPLVLPLPATNGFWQYINIPIPLGTIRAQNSIPLTTKTSITVLGYNQKTGTQVLVDSLRFQPVDATFFAQVYDPTSNLPLGSLEPNGGTYHLIRDENSIVTARVGPDLSVTSFSIPSFARLLTADQSYSETLPNTDLECSAGSAAVYQNFEASDAAQWTLPAGWTIGNGQLAFTGTASGPRGSAATLKGFTSANYVAYVRFVPPGGSPQPNVGVGCGNVLVYHDTASNNWVLSALVGQAWQNLALRSAPIEREDLVFVLLDGRVSFFAGGQQIFSSVLPSGTVADGTLNLYLTSTGSFQSLIALIDPELRLVMLDGRGIAQQSINLRDETQVGAYGLVYDAVGLPSYDKNSVYVPVAESDNRILGGATNYLPAVGGQPQTLDHYLAYGNGSPFMRTAFEPSPVARPQQLGQPGDLLAIGGSHAGQFAYAQNTAAGPMAGLVPNAQAGNYHLITATDPDQTTNYALVSPEGEMMAQRTMLSSSVSLTNGYDYDGAGRLVAAKPPNFFSQGLAPSWETTYTRDFLGQVISTTSPDSGTTQFAYDSLGRLRFRLDATGAALTPPKIAYYKYDGQNRVIEAGTVQNAAVTWTTALAQVNTITWPGSDLAPVILQKVSYDIGPGSPLLAYTEGRITQVSTYKASGALGVQETYSYDARGNIVSQWTQAPDYDGTIWLSTYAYDSRNRLIRIDYPRATTDGGPPLSVIYTYDRLGRITSVGQAPPSVIDPLDPPPDLSALYGSFTYNADDTLALVSYNNQPGGTTAIPVSYTYTEAGWRLSMTSPIYSESITYTDGGYGNSGYYAGQVASVAATWQMTANALYPLQSYSTQFAYDPAGRLTAAAPYLAPDAGQSGPLPISYDPNGNLLSVQRGAVTSTYSYPVTTTDRLQSVTAQLTTTCNFEGAQPPGWTWGASDGGPGGPSVVAGGPTGSTHCLNIPGGTLGMSNYLAYRADIDPNGQYTMSYWIKADAAFASQKGDARWCLVFYGPQGPVATVTVQQLTNVPTTWTQLSVPFDIHAHYTAEAMNVQVTAVALVLYNSKASPDVSLPGAAIQVDNLSLTGNGSTGTLTYDASGRVLALPGSGLSAMSYDTESNALVSFQTTTDGGYRVDLALNLTGQNTTQVLTGTNQVARAGVLGNTTPAASPSLTLHAPNGQVLARLDQQDGATGTVRRRYMITGPEGVFAVEDDGKFCYVMSGYDQSVRAVADDQCQLIQAYNYDAFGNLKQSYGGDPIVEPIAPYGLDLSATATYVPTLAREASPTLPLSPDQGRWEKTPPPAGGYGKTLFQRIHAKGLENKYYNILANLLWLHFVQGEEFISHNPDVWYPYLWATSWGAGTWSAYATVLASPFMRNRRWGILAGLAGSALLSAGPQLTYGIWRFGYIKYYQRSCADRGLMAISNEALAEDIYHWQFYESPEAVGGKRLRHRNVEPIPDGYYIFVVNEQGEFLYREMYDRAGGTQLYVRHSALNGGECAQSAGMMSILGKEIIITNKSGHYGPALVRLKIALDLLINAGYQEYSIRLEDYEKLDLGKLMKSYLAARKLTEQKSQA